MELCYANNPNSLFRKYRKLVTLFTRHKLGRDYLGIKHGDIGLLLPNGYIRKQDDVCQMIVSTRSYLAPKLYPALLRLDTIQHYLGSIDEALKTLTFQLGLTRNYGFAPNVFLNSLVAYPDANPETTTVDGDVGRAVGGDGETFATIKAGAGTGVEPSTADIETAQIGASGATDKYNYLNRGIFLFDTSALTADATISATTLALYGTLNTDELSQAIGVILSNPSSNTDIATGDYGTFTFTRQADDIDQGSISTSAYNTWTLNATGRGNVSKTGVSKFGVAVSCDIDNAAPSWLNQKFARFKSYSSDNGSNKPTLTVTYSLPFIPKVVMFV